MTTAIFILMLSLPLDTAPPVATDVVLSVHRTRTMCERHAAYHNSTKVPGVSARCIMMELQ